MKKGSYHYLIPNRLYRSLYKDPYLRKKLGLKSRKNRLTVKSVKDKAKTRLDYQYVLASYYDYRKYQSSTIKVLKKLLEKSVKDEKYRYLSFKAYRLLLINLRYTGSRQRAAHGYKILSDFWIATSLDKLPKFLNRRKLILERINDHLWTARYQALIGNKVKALYYSDVAFNDLNKNETLFKNKRQYGQYKELLSEAYYLRSFKIHLYYGDYEDADKWAEKAIKRIKLDRKWKKDLLWVHGLAHFLKKEYKLASKHWKKSLRYIKKKSSKAKTYFWLARASKLSGNKKDEDKYSKKLERRYPFNFYSMLKKNRYLINGADNDNTHKVTKVSRRKLTRSIIRSEMLIEMKMYDFAQTELKHTYRLLRPRRYNKNNLQLYTYINKLFYKARLYHKSIAFSEQLARRYRKFWQKNPEQISLYYPIAYLENFSKAAKEANVGLPVLYGISRQESLFRKNAVSYANAIGLMQITPGTAQVLAKKLNMNMDSPTKELKKIQKNLKLGSHYLQKLRNRYRFERSPKAAMIAAYNAGEYAVDQWLEKIKVNDDLLWIEILPFRQTRNYIKFVLSNMKIYQTLLNHSRPEKQHYMLYTQAKIDKKIKG